MWSHIKQVLSYKTVEEYQDISVEEWHIATAALMVHAACVDDDFSQDEKQRLQDVLSEKFSLDQEDVALLIKEAYNRQQQTIDLHEFTRVIAREFDQVGRQNMIKLLWEIILADGVIDNFEDNLIRKVGSLLGVSAYHLSQLKEDVLNNKDTRGN